MRLSDHDMQLTATIGAIVTISTSIFVMLLKFVGVVSFTGPIVPASWFSYLIIYLPFLTFIDIILAIAIYILSKNSGNLNISRKDKRSLIILFSVIDVAISIVFLSFAGSYIGPVIMGAAGFLMNEK